MPISEKDFQQLSERVALLGQAGAYQQEQIKENTASCKETRDEIIAMKAKWGVMALLAGSAGTVITGLVMWVLKSKLGV